MALLRRAVSQLLCSGSFYLCYNISLNLSTPEDLAGREGKAGSVATRGEKEKSSGSFICSRSSLYNVSVFLT